MELVVEHIGGPRRGEIDRFPAARITVGRMSSASVVIDDPDVDYEHLEIVATPQGIVVTDLGSSTGTSVAGQPITGPTLLPSGAVVELGRTVALRLALEGAPPPFAPPPPPAPAGQTIVAGAVGMGAAPPGAGGLPPGPASPGAVAAPPPAGPAGTMILGGAVPGTPAAVPAAPPPPGASPAPAVGPLASAPPAAAATPSGPDRAGARSSDDLRTFILWVALGSLLALGLLVLIVLLLLG